MVTTAEEDPFEEDDKTLNKRNEKTWKSELEKMPHPVIARLLESKVHMSDCLICWDVINNGMILPKCGHAYCRYSINFIQFIFRECINTFMDGKEIHEQLCPQCRGAISLPTLIPIGEFLTKHNVVIKEELPVFSLGNSNDFTDVDVKEREEQVLHLESTFMSHSFIKRLKKSDRTKSVSTLLSQHSRTWMTSSKITSMMSILKNTRDNRLGEKTIGIAIISYVLYCYSVLIVFSQFTTFLDLLERPLIENGFHFTRYDGTMNMKERSESIKRFKEDINVNVMIISLKCGSLGLNLVCANHVILV